MPEQKLCPPVVNEVLRAKAEETVAGAGGQSEQEKGLGSALRIPQDSDT